MGSVAWGEKLRQMPREETLLGEGRRDLRFMGELVWALKEARYDPLAIPTSQEWVCTTEIEQTQFYREQRQEAERVQQALYEQALHSNGSPEVPKFNAAQAAGGALQWNQLQIWDTVGRRQTIHPRCPPGIVPDMRLFDRFLECRLDGR